ncbi:MAG: ATP-binding cassette domain-containing protein [Steroidobacteraceae bacterium]
MASETCLVSGVALRLEQVSIVLGGRVLIPPLTEEVSPGTVLTLMGPSGSGKSTLLSFLGGTLASPFRAGGRIWVGAREVTALPAERRRIGTLFQDDLLFPHLTVGENLAFGLARTVRGRRARATHIAAVLAHAGLEGFAARDPATLSGGQRARVALLRLLLAEPQVLLLDEPFNRLDAALRAEFRQFVFAHAAAAALPVLLVTHDGADAEAAGGTVLALRTDVSATTIIERVCTAGRAGDRPMRPAGLEENEGGQ